MPRFTTKVFIDLAIWMSAFGLLIGACFPFFARLLGVAPEQVLTPLFFVAAMSAGLAAGAANFALARRVIRPRLHLLAHHMELVETAIRGATFTGDWSSCTLDKCRVTVDSQDEIGQAADAFNDLVAALFRAHEVETAVSDFSQTLSSQLDLKNLANVALDQLLRHTGAQAGVVLTEASGELLVSARYGLRDPQALADSDHVRKALRSGRCLKVELPEDLHIEMMLADVRPREIMVVPVVFKETPLGVVVLAANRRFSPEEEWLMGLFRQGFGLALNNALAHDRLQRIAALDPLTGAYNRRFGATRLREEYNRALRTGSPLGLLMVDLDHFKTINDTYGHIVGDRVLDRVAKAIRNAVREGDILVRYGGEEFLVILPGASCEDAHQVAERIRHMVQDTIVKDGDQTVCVTASIGATSFPQTDVEDEEAMLRLADEALYRAKRQGRNQVVMSA